MAKRAFDKIAAGLNDAIAIAEGRADPTTYRIHVPTEVDVKAIRARLKLTQAGFAVRFGLPIGNVRDWEQGRSRPDQSSRILLRVIEREPEAVVRALETEAA